MKATKKSSKRIVMPDRLRQRAEQRLAETQREIAEMSAADVQKLVHELQVHQVELEMQNEELRRVQLEIENSRARYAELYDFSPVGRLTLDASGVILEANLTGARLLGIHREQLVAKKLAAFVARESRDALYEAQRRALSSRVEQTFELVMRRQDGSTFVGEMEASTVQDHRHNRPDQWEWMLAFSDISERKHAEEQMRASLREISDLKAALDEHAIVAITNPQGKITYANDKFCAISKYSREELIGQDHRLVNSGFHPKEFIRDLWTTIARGKIWHGEIKNQAKDGSNYWVDTTIVPFLGKDGKPRQYVVIRADITERKRVEEALREREEQLRLFVAHAPAAIAMFDTRMCYLVASERWLSTYGLTAQAIYGRSHYEMFPEIPQRWKKIHRRCLAGAVERADEDRFEQAGGRMQRVRWEVRPWYSPAGAIGGIVIFTEDITARKQAEDALWQEQALLQNLTRAIPDHLYFKDRQSRFIRINDTMAKAFGLRDPGEAVGKTDFDFFARKYARQAYEDEQRLLRTGEPLIGKDEMETWRDGRVTWVSSTKVPLRDASGGITGLVGISRDISDRKAGEERAAKARRVRAILSGVDHAIVHTRSQKRMLAECCRVAVKTGGFKLAWIGMVVSDGSVQPVAQAGQTGYLKGQCVVIHDVPEGRGPVGTAIRENRHVVVEDIARDPSMIPWRGRARRFGLRYAAAFPLRVGDKPVGSFQLYAPRANSFDEDEVRLLTQISGEISFALTALDANAKRRQAEQARSKSELELSDFFEKSPLALLWVGPAGQILRANKAELALLGRPEKQVLGRPASRFHAEPKVLASMLDRLSQGEIVRDFRAFVRRPDGNLRHVLIDANGRWEQQRLVHSRWFVRDITRAVELEWEILAISEREQQRIGQDLHDDLCQQLTGIQFLSDGLARDLAATFPGGAAEARTIAEHTRQALADSRELARGLSPVGLEAEGLMDALRLLALRITRVFRRDCRFQCGKPARVPDRQVAIHLYRIAQEAATNAVKHGNASRIEIELSAMGRDIRLAVRNDGTSIKPGLASQNGMGLRIMQYRAHAIGGTLMVQKKPDGGTEVACTVKGGLVPPEARTLK